MTLTITAIVLLVLCSAFFSASETALTAASRPLMHHLAETGNRRAGLVNQLRTRTDRLLGAILLGNNLVNILASSLATSALIVLFGDAGVVYATISITLLVLIFGEVLPKTYAYRRANHVALWVAPPIRALVVVLAPVTLAINGLVQGVLHLFGGRKRGVSGAGPGAAELRGAIALHAGDGEVAHERAMLHSILDLQEVVVGEVMTHRKGVTMINADDAPAAVVAQALASPFTRFPVWRADPDNIIGIIHVKDLLRAVHGPEGRGELSLGQLTVAPWFVPESTTLYDQLQAFRRRREHFALVVDEYGSLMGIVTLEDILEEIVGEIDDEHDLVIPGVNREPGGSLLVQGTVTIRDLNREFGWRLPDAEAVTLAGLVLHEARRIPDIGEVFDIEGFRCEICRRHRHQITAVRIIPPAEAGPAAASEPA